jgi:hypothetical protein
MAAHAEIIVRAPDGHLPFVAVVAVRAPGRKRESRGVTLEIGEDPVALLALQRLQSGFETA